MSKIIYFIDTLLNFTDTLLFLMYLGVVSAVKDQGYCGSCWAFASTEVIESHVAIATNKLFDLSPEQVGRL